MARKPKYRRHTSRDRAFVEWNGKRHYLAGAYKSHESLRAYQDFCRQNVPQFVLTASGPAKLTVAQLADGFQGWADKNYPPVPRSEASNVRAALKPLRQMYGTLNAADFAPKHLTELQERLATRQRARTYVNQCAAKIKRAFKWGAVEGLIPDTVYNAIALVPGLRRGRSQALENPSRKPATWEQVSSVLGEVSPTVWAMVHLQWLTGIRSQSICEARVDQFNRSKQPWEWRPRHKTESRGVDLVVFIGPQAQAVLLPFLAGRKGSDYLFHPKRQGGTRAKGYRSFYDAVSYLRALSRGQNRVNAKRIEQGLDPLPKWTPHQIRHAKATAVRASHGLEAAQATLGHQTLSAAQIYAQRQSELARQVAAEHG
jgi:integrase